MEVVHEGGYGDHVIHADYSHSLTGALLIALMAGLLAGRLWGKRGGLVIAATVFSHWLLDLLVHRADLPLLPGNLGNLPLLGLGAWKFPAGSIVLESVLIAAGFLMYYRSVVNGAERGNKALAVTAGAVMGILLVLSLITVLGGA